MSGKHVKTDLEILLGALDKLRIQDRSEFQLALGNYVRSGNYLSLWESFRQALKEPDDAG